ncbi:MAG: plastocyanin/azurin family copper-binding protein [Anaerolineaceae bacterium]
MNRPSRLLPRSHRPASSSLHRWGLLVLVLLVPQVGRAQAHWRAEVGAQSDDKAVQAMAFFPTEIWIHAGDSITWRSNVSEIHTVTFLKENQVRPPFQVGCPGFASDHATFDGSTCVTTPPVLSGQTFTVKFPVAGNFKLTCLVHENMAGVVHVYDAGQPLPHNQRFYDEKGAIRRANLLADTDARHHAAQPSTKVTAGIGETSATAGGANSSSIVRFLDDPTTIHAGQTVEWTNRDPVLPHTITFGQGPQGNPVPPSSNVTVDQDGARHGTVASPSDSVHSGFIVAAPQERTGLKQAPLGVTRFRVTFPNAGTFPYVCALHDGLGMTGTVIVEP